MMILLVIAFNFTHCHTSVLQSQFWNSKLIGGQLIHQRRIEDSVSNTYDGAFLQK